MAYNLGNIVPTVVSWNQSTGKFSVTNLFQNDAEGEVEFQDCDDDIGEDAFQECEQVHGGIFDIDPNFEIRSEPEFATHDRGSFEPMIKRRRLFTKTHMKKSLRNIADNAVFLRLS